MVTKEQIANELMKIGFADLRKAYTVDNALKPIRELDDDTAAAITGVKVTEEFEGSGEDRLKTGETVEVKFNPKRPALAELNKMFGYYAPIKTALTNKEGEDVKQIMQVSIVAPENEDE